jgi:hypothetical protein
VIVGSGPQSTNCIPIPEKENSTTADQLPCQGKVIISHYLVGNEWAIHLELKIKITLKCRPDGYLRCDILVSLQIKTYILEDI